MLEADGGYGDPGFDPETEFDPVPEALLARGAHDPGEDALLAGGETWPAEDDGEDTPDELAATAVPGLGAEAEVLIEMLAAAAEAAPTEEEACSLVGGLTIHILSAAPFVVRRVAPVIIRRSAGLVRVLRRTPARRSMIGAVPLIVKRTAATLVRKAGKGRPVNGRVAARVLGKQARRVLGTPARRTLAMRAVRNHRQRVGRLLSSRRLTRRAESVPGPAEAWP